MKERLRLFTGYNRDAELLLSREERITMQSCVIGDKEVSTDLKNRWEMVSTKLMSK